MKNALRLSPLQHMVAVVGAVAIPLMLISGAAANAQARGGSYYNATLTTAAHAPRTVAGALIWNCSGTACTAPRGTSRPAVVCARLVRELGPVSAFSADGRALEGADLERCNAAAGA